MCLLNSVFIFNKQTSEAKQSATKEIPKRFAMQRQKESPYLPLINTFHNLS